MKISPLFPFRMRTDLFLRWFGSRGSSAGHHVLRLEALVGRTVILELFGTSASEWGASDARKEDSAAGLVLSLVVAVLFVIAIEF